MARAWLLLPLLCACVDGPGDGGDLPDADFDMFVEDVEPLLIDACGQSNCHGAAERPLEVYGPGIHRMEPIDPSSEDPLTDDEHRGNFLSAAGFLIDVDEADESPLLAKPLPIAEGGSRHATGPVFEGVEDSDYLILFDWVVDALGEGGMP